MERGHVAVVRLSQQQVAGGKLRHGRVPRLQEPTRTEQQCVTEAVISTAAQWTGAPFFFTPSRVVWRGENEDVLTVLMILMILMYREEQGSGEDD